MARSGAALLLLLLLLCYCGAIEEYQDTTDGEFTLVQTAHFCALGQEGLRIKPFLNNSRGKGTRKIII
jgi:hypothetical protein